MAGERDTDAQPAAGTGSPIPSRPCAGYLFMVAWAAWRRDEAACPCLQPAA